VKKSSLKASLLLGWVVGAVWIVGVVDAQVPDQPAIPAPTVEIAQGGSQAMTYRVSLDEMYLSGKGRQKIPVQASLENLKTLAVDLILATKETVYLVLYPLGEAHTAGNRRFITDEIVVQADQSAVAHWNKNQAYSASVHSDMHRDISR
jgi:hypothetical protein